VCARRDTLDVPRVSVTARSALRAPVVAKQETLRRGSVRTWDGEGEPSSRAGLAPVHRLLSALRTKKLATRAPHARALLEALHALVFPDGPWKCPLARAVARCPARVTNAAAAAPSSSKASPPTLRLTVHVYLSRLAFELIACEHLELLLRHLTPAGRVAPVKPLPTHPRTLFPPPGAASADAAEDQYTLPSLLKGMEHAGYRAEPQPRGIALAMFDYQRQALAWMLDQEGRPGGLNAAFWETRTWADAPRGARAADEWYYFPLAGELRVAKPPHVTGGVLCEQMGLGACACLHVCLVHVLSTRRGIMLTSAWCCCRRRLQARRSKFARSSWRTWLPRRLPPPPPPCAASPPLLPHPRPLPPRSSSSSSSSSSPRHRAQRWWSCPRPCCRSGAAKSSAAPLACSPSRSILPTPQPPLPTAAMMKVTTSRAMHQLQGLRGALGARCACRLARPRRPQHATRRRSSLRWLTTT
jgi:hypothetical protein